MPNVQKSAANVHDCQKENSVNEKITILYQRLSVDDGNSNNESDSIQNQRRILEEYAERNGLIPYINIHDDGYSGTVWNRPGWQKVIQEIKSGRVQTLVLKNLDRMGRDYLRVGLYMEMFREKKVRLIAVGDGIDTFEKDDDFTPFRAIFAEYYARDCSRKIRAVKHSKGKLGKPMSANPPYGYMKDPTNKDKWAIDTEAAAVVRRIFEMAIDGMGPNKIAQKLHEEKIERPSYYLAQRGCGTFKNIYDKEQPYSWSDTSIVHILEKLEYAGHTVNFKGENANFKNKKYVPKPKEEWLIFRDTHEQIVTEEMWELVQKLRQTRRRHDTLGEANPLTGLLFCGNCGAKMYNCRSVTAPIFDVYDCSTFKRTQGTVTTKCKTHLIQTKIVKQVILELLRETNGYIRENEKEFIACMQENTALKKTDTAKVYAKKIAKNEKRIAELEKIFRSLYEDKALEKITQTMFDEMSAGYKQEQEDLKIQTSQMKTELNTFNDETASVEKFLKLIKKFTDFDELTPTILNEFVEKIIVHESEWSEGRNPKTGRGMGTRSQKIEVYLKYIGNFNVPDKRTPEEIQAENAKWEQLERDRASKREYARKQAQKKQAKTKKQA